MSDQYDYDLFYHALNYRGAQYGNNPEIQWQNLLACHNRIVARAVSDSEKDAERYQKVRKMNARQFADLFAENIKSGVPFDDLIDARVNT